MAAAWANSSYALRGFYGLADILTLLDEVLCLEISNLMSQLKFKPAKNDDHYLIKHLTKSLWLRNMELTIVSSTSSSKRPVHDQINVVYAEKQLESMVTCLIEERGRCHS